MSIGDHDRDSATVYHLPPLHEILGDYLPQTRSKSSSRQGSPDSLPSQGSVHHAPESPHANAGLQLPPISPSRSSFPPSQHSPQPIVSPTYSCPFSQESCGPQHSYDLFNYSPDHGLIHQKSSKSQEELEELKPKTRSIYVDDMSRKYVCSECGKRFAKPSTLRNHTMTHTGEKPFVCPHPGCGRPFSMASNMQRHMRTHTSGSAFHLVPNGEEEEVSSGRTSEE